MYKKFYVYEVSKEPYGVFVTVATYKDAERVIQEDIALEEQNGNYDYGEDDYYISQVAVFTYTDNKED